jgi:hypothetical protein
MEQEEPMAIYTGGCHCGAVRYEVEADLAHTVTCNCSICSKTGTILTFAPATSFKLLSGEELLTDYQFNRKIIHHLFCTTCGIRSFSRGRMPDGTETVAINVRCLDGVDVAGLAPRAFDGKSL